MRRLLIAACWLVVLGAVAAGLALSSRLGPERLRGELERRLSAAVGPVEIDGLRPYFGWGVGVEIVGIRSVADGGASTLGADRVWITLALRGLLRGEVIPRRVDVRGLRALLTQRADGSWEPPLVARLLERASSPPDTADAKTTPAEAEVRAIVDALPALAIEGGVVRVVREHAQGPDAELEVRDLYLDLTRNPLGGAPRLGITARLVEAQRQRGQIDVEAAIEPGGVQLDVALTDADLAAVRPWLRVGDLRFDASGRVSGTASWRPAPGGGALVLDLIGFDLDLGAWRGDGPRVAASLPAARLHATTAIDARSLRVAKFEWSAEPTLLTGSASLERPVRDGARLGIEIRGGPISTPLLRDLFLALTPQSDPLRERAAALRAGDLDDFSLRADPTPIADWRALAESPLEAWPESLAVETRLRGGEVALGSESLRELAAQVQLRHEHIEITGARAKLDARALPELSLKLSGLRAVAAVLAAGAVPKAVPALPGLGAIDAWVEAQKRPGSPPRWRTIDVDADWIEHPALLRPIEQFTARLTPANPGVHIENAKGIWGGVPFEGTVSFVGGDHGRVDVDLALALPRRGGRLRSNAEAWLRTRFRAELEKLGDFQAEELSGVVQAIGDRAELRHGAAKLRPRGDLTGIVDLDLSRADSVPYHARVELVNGSLSELMSDLKMDGGAANGTADIDTELTGVLIAHHNLLADSSGPANLRLRDGEILKRMNVLFSIAQASDTLNPFRSRETIPYDTIDAPLQIGGGFASTEGLSLQGDALRLVGTGRVNLVEEPHEVEAVIGIFYFRALDRVISVFPLLNRMLLGPDDNLVSTYFAVAGPWRDPRAKIIPSKSLASGPGSFVLEGLPSFVRGGLSTLERLFSATEPPPPGAPATGATP